MLKSGDTFERYTIETSIGQGGMGCVYRAHDARLGRRVALKVISDGATTSEADARLLREARAAAALDHPNAVAIFDVGEINGAPYIVMELVEGDTLRRSIGSADPPLKTRIAWLADTARALAAAHRRGLVHRDIKPENVMVREDGVVKVLDFGIARRTGGNVDPHGSTQTSALPTLTVEGVRVGTPVYMSPEQIRGEALDGRSDQFAWGVLAFELCSGKLPWRGTSDALAVVASILTDDPVRSSLDEARVPAEIQAVILRALAKKSADRFASMDDLVRALEAAAKGEAPDPAPRVASADPAPAAASSDPGATAAQRFSTGEIREVLGRAIEQQAAGGSAAKLGFEELLAAAKEVGVDEEALRDQSRALRLREQNRAVAENTAAEQAAWIRRQRRAFYRHAGIYVIVNVALFVLGNIVHALPWTLMPALAWAIGLGIHGLIALTAHADDWAEEKQGMNYWHERQRRRHELALAKINEKAGRSGRRHRLPEPPRRFEAAPPSAGKVRIGGVDEADQADAEAEDEAAAEAREGKRKRR